LNLTGTPPDDNKLPDTTAKEWTQMLKNINLQLFAEDTIPPKAEEAKPVEAKEPSAIFKAFGLKPKDLEKKLEPEKKPETEVKQEVKPETEQEPETKVPEKPAEEEFETLTYLGKEVKVPVADRKKYMQMGYDYPHVKEEAAKAKAALQRVAKLEGFDKVDDYLAELDKKEKAVIAEKIEEAAGDPDKINEIIENHPKVIKVLEKDRINAYKEAKAELSKDQFFKELEPELDRVMEQNPSAVPALVYKVIRSDFLTPDRIKELITKEKESAVKTTIADIHDKVRRATPTGGDTNEGKEIIRPTSIMSAMASAFGVSANKVAQRIAKSKK
jgi:hypothetical protein